VVIAGMGGDTLVDILAAAPWCRETALLLQPMSRAEVLRPWLAENGFAIRRERLVQDRGVLYPILDVSGGEMALSESEAWGGVLLGDDPLWGRFLEEQILRLRRAAAGLSRARDSTLSERRETFLRIAGALEEKKGEFEYAHSS
jgi:tRNA (adenine22-N1)-methyltransferase